uniref:PTBP1-like RNA recognition motif 2 domain-containing protein n=1 Tax=Oryza rufipogon TaxID=4529 RepID=A0A0E0QJ33_ORYRU
MASGHGNLVSEPLTMAFDAERVLHVTMINLLYPVMEDLLHQVFYVYGSEEDLHAPDGNTCGGFN